MIENRGNHLLMLAKLLAAPRKKSCSARAPLRPNRVFRLEKTKAVNPPRWVRCCSLPETTEASIRRLMRGRVPVNYRHWCAQLSVPKTDIKDSRTVPPRNWFEEPRAPMP